MFLHFWIVWYIEVRPQPNQTDHLGVGSLPSSQTARKKTCQGPTLQLISDVEKRLFDSNVWKVFLSPNFFLIIEKVVVFLQKNNNEKLVRPRELATC